MPSPFFCISQFLNLLLSYKIWIIVGFILLSQQKKIHNLNFVFRNTSKWIKCKHSKIIKKHTPTKIAQVNFIIVNIFRIFFFLIVLDDYYIRVKMRIDFSVNKSTYLNYMVNSINIEMNFVIFSFDIQHEGSSNLCVSPPLCELSDQLSCSYYVILKMTSSWMLLCALLHVLYLSFHNWDI